MSKKLQLRFGALCPAIKDQLKEQDFLFGKDEVKHFQEDADAITRLRVRGYCQILNLTKSVKKERRKRKLITASGGIIAALIMGIMITK